MGKKDRNVLELIISTRNKHAMKFKTSKNICIHTRMIGWRIFGWRTLCKICEISDFSLNLA